jgi:hypothetical protein
MAQFFPGNHVPGIAQKDLKHPEGKVLQRDRTFPLLQLRRAKIGDKDPKFQEFLLL